MSSPGKKPIIQDYSKLDNIQLESAWQAQATFIKIALTEYYKTSDIKLRKIAENAQSTQSEIQKEITRRAH